MRFLIAPDKFKGSLDARAVAEQIALGIRDVMPDAEIVIAPIADGGEGTAEAICGARAGEWVTCAAHDALGRTIQARYAWLADAKTAVMDMSEAAGLRRLLPNERDVRKADSFGVGEMLLHAANRGAREIIVGLGGSATNDGGVGLARALGFRFLDRDSVEILTDVLRLSALVRIVRPADLALPSIVAATDVRNPFLGARGASHTYARQKGADDNQIEAMEEALTRLADVAANDLGNNFRDVPGAGAAGGLGFGLLTFCGAQIREGFDVIAEIIELKSAVAKSDIVITGEGSLDRQTLEGKGPGGVAHLARALGKRVYAIAGRAADDAEVHALFDGVFTVAHPSISEAECFARAGDLLRTRGSELARALTA